MLDYIEKNTKTFRVYTLGCKVNQYDSQVLREKFRYAGFVEATRDKLVDVCVINTCTVTSKADSKSRSLIKKAVRDNPKAEIVVAGCYAQENAELLSKIKGVSFVVDNDRREKLLELIDTNLPRVNIPTPLANFNSHTRAFVKIQDGCDNFCSYCKVPYVRGRSRSRAIEEVKLEVQNLSENGFKEVVLCGICLGDFGKGLSKKTNLVELIEELEEIPNLRRIRLSSIEAKDVTGGFIRKIASSNKVCKHLHIPFQSGDDKILKLMDRNYSQGYYIDLIDKIKKGIEDVAITTDVIVGFPGESDENFQNTVRLLEKVAPLRTHIFPFSARKSTKAYSLKNALADNVIKDRVDILKDAAAKFSLSYRRGFLNRELDILIEASLDKRYHCLSGHSSNYIKVFINGKSANKNHINKLVSARIIRLEKENTWAELVSKQKG